jgi:hypothetical protein
MSYRTILDTVELSSSLAALSHGAERLFWRMLAKSDPYGRLHGEPAKVRAQCMPLLKRVRDIDVETWLDELEGVHRIVRYAGDGKALIQLVDFDENQAPDFLRKRGVSRFPEPPENLNGKTPYLQDERPKGGLGRPKGGEGRVEVGVEVEENEQPLHPSVGFPASPKVADVLSVLSVIDKSGYQAARLTGERIASLLEDFPDRDHVREAKALADWERFGGGSGKETKDGITRYRNWLRRAEPADKPKAEPKRYGRGVTAATVFQQAGIQRKELE